MEDGRPHPSCRHDDGCRRLLCYHGHILESAVARFPSLKAFSAGMQNTKSNQKCYNESIKPKGAVPMLSKIAVDGCLQNK